MSSSPYRKSGDGPALVLVHGWPFHTGSYRKLLPLLEPRFTCYLVESAGMSDRAPFQGLDMTFAGHARRLIELIDELQLDQVLLLGHNTGGTIARIASAELKGRVSKLAVLNTEMPNHRPPFIPLYQKLTHLPGTRQIMGALMTRDWYIFSAMGFGGCFHDKRFIDREFRSLFAEHWFETPTRFRGFIRYLQCLDFATLDRLDDIHAEISAPIHFIWGENDITFPCALAKEMVKRIPQGAGFCAIPDSAFLLHEERPETVAAELLNFFQSGDFQ
ncbi:MAG: alpha/beta fold hydrolase [Pseudomonadales bacterium]